MADLAPTPDSLINMLANPPSPFAQFGGPAGYMGFMARQAQGNAASQAIDPTTGQFDQGKYNALLSQNRWGRFGLPEAVQQSGQSSEAQLRAETQGETLQQQQMATVQARLNGLANINFPLQRQAMASSSDPTKPFVTGAQAMDGLNQAKAAGYFRGPEGQAEYDAQLEQLKQIGPTGNANNWVMAVGATLGEGLNRTTVLRGNPQYVTTPQGQNLENPSQYSAGAAGPSFLPSMFSQEFLYSPADSFYDRNGRFVSPARNIDYINDGRLPPGGIPASAYAGAGGAGGGGQGAPPAAAPGTPTWQQMGGPQQPPGAGTPAPDQQQGAPPGAPAAGGTSQLGAPPFAMQTVGETGIPQGYTLSPQGIKDSQAAFGDVRNLKASFANRTSPLDQVATIMDQYPNLQTAGGAGLAEATQVLQGFGINLGNKDQATAFEEARKGLQQYLAKMPGAGRSDLAQQLNAEAVAHIGQGPDAIRNLVAKAIGLERMGILSYDYFVNAPGNNGNPNLADYNSAQFQPYTAAWASSLDPMAASLDRQTPKALNEYVGTLKKIDPSGQGVYGKFLNSVLWVHWLHPEWTILPQGSAAPARAAPKIQSGTEPLSTGRAPITQGQGTAPPAFKPGGATGGFGGVTGTAP